MSYDVAFSYAWEAPDEVAYVRRVANRVRDEGFEVYLDQQEAHVIRRENIRERLHEIYRNAPLCVLFLSDAYRRSVWCNFERRTAQDEGRRPLLGRFDDTEIPGILHDDHAERLRHTEPEEFARSITSELRSLGIAPAEGPFARELTYGLGFGPPVWRVAYIPANLSESWQRHYDERPSEQLRLIADRTPFELRRFRDERPMRQGQDLARCRLVSYAVHGDRIDLTLCRTSYRDYLRSNELIDFRKNPGTNTTLREEFLSSLQPAPAYIQPFDELTNICGVGVFVITRDNHLVVTRHSDDTIVYPGRWTFSASGTMPWGACPHPYTAVISKAREEIHHLVNPHTLKLYAFGVDARKLYFQFSFVEVTDFSFAELQRQFEESHHLLSNSPRELKKLRFDPQRVCMDLVENCWEPAAEAALLALLEHRYPGGVEIALTSPEIRPRLWKRAMRDEWEHRAMRPGLLPDMSVRYDQERLEEESRNYVASVMRFMETHIEGKSVVEIGCGTGRLSEELVRVAARPLTCIDLSAHMIARNRERLANPDERDVSYIEGFAQDALAGKQYDVIVCSLVLIHNVTEQSFSSLVRRMCESAPRIFVFENVKRDSVTSPATVLRSADALEAAFGGYGFRVDARNLHSLFGDEILFLNLRQH